MATVGLVFICGGAGGTVSMREQRQASGWSQRRGGAFAECALGILIRVLGSHPQPS